MMPASRKFLFIITWAAASVFGFAVLYALVLKNI